MNEKETDYRPGDEPVAEGTIKRYYPDGVAYHLWPVGVPRSFGNRDRGVYFARRTSFRIHEEGDR